MDIYTKNGIIIRQQELTDQLSELELEYLDIPLSKSMLYSLATFCLAFLDRQPIDFVFSSHTRQKIVVNTADFDPNAQSKLIEAALKVHQNVGKLYTLADQFYYDKDDTGILETNHSAQLNQYKKTNCIGKELIAHFIQAIAQSRSSD